MSGWDKLGEWIGALLLSSLAWVSGVLVADPSSASTAGAAFSDNVPPLIWSWAQSDDEPPIEQVGEGEGADTETLDEETPPAEGEEPADDAETLDTGAPPTAEEDVELLDQGSPPAAAPVVDVSAPPADTVYVAPVDVAPAPTGPVLPPDFGTGTVHVVAGQASFPVGLESCHVGAVTGRAYVGIDCGDGGSIVGHAPTFQDFPFVSDDFPFGEGSVFDVVAGDAGSDDDIEVIAAAGLADSGFFAADEADEPVVETRGPSSVQFAQRSREREPRVRVSDDKGRHAKQSSKKKERDARAAVESDRDGRAKSDAKADKGDEREGSEKKSKKAKDKGKKNQKQRAEGKDKDKKKRGAN